MLQVPPSVRELKPSLERIAAEIDTLFEAELANSVAEGDQLREAMLYASVGGGKRLRPLLLVQAAELFGVARHLALRAGMAVECVHVQSLIHDDLPCMDDDDLRRGKATVHRAYCEATAVLAGDALHALAFEILADSSTHPDSAVRAELVVQLARAVGVRGMAGGQMLDLSDAAGTLADVTRLNHLKTGSLICWCLEAGAVMGYAPWESRLHLRGYGACLGLAFQIVDDLLDVTGNLATLGKRVGKDAQQGKCNFATLLGVEGARREAERLIEQAQEHLSSFGEDAVLLRAIARFVLDRKC